MLFSELAKQYLEDKENGRKKVRLNTLEGYNLAVQAGVPIEVVARQLGHSGITLAYERYVCRSIDLLRAGQKRFAELILKAAPKGRLEAMFAT